MYHNIYSNISAILLKFKYNARGKRLCKIDL